MSTTARLSNPTHDAEARPRNRRLGTATVNGAGAVSSSSASRPSSLLTSSRNQSPQRGASPMPATRIGGTSSRSSSRPAASSYLGESSLSAGKGWLDTSWTAGWSSVQDLASSILGGDSQRGSPRQSMIRTASGTARNSAPSAWGPEPPTDSRPGINDVAAGTIADRDAAFKARKTASVLESHEGVNGGLDVTGKFKRRNSDEQSGDNVAHADVEDQLVYIHHVQASDTYAGIILRYRCQEDAFRKANGLWSRDNIQIRKWLAIPVDACEVKGRPCEPPSFYSREVDHLAATPAATPGFSSPLRVSTTSNPHDDFFASQSAKVPEEAVVEEEKPWTHVRWDKLDHCKEPVEIGRVARKAMGYFPPRRKKSVRTISTLSTPRGSLDVPNITLGADLLDSPDGSSRRQSMLANRPNVGSTYASSASTPARSRVGSGNDDLRPAWMKRPGGVGSLSRTVRAPGPEKDYFNTWTKKHLPGLNIDSLPSMAIMGSETARFGFNEEAAAIVESPFEDGRDATATNQHGTGLDKAAATIEMWVRGAWAKRPNTPILGPNRPRGGEGDLIELEDTSSEDGRLGGLLDQGDSSLLNSSLGSSSRSDENSLMRGRMPARGLSKDKKAD